MRDAVGALAVPEPFVLSRGFVRGVGWKRSLISRVFFQLVLTGEIGFRLAQLHLVPGLPPSPLAQGSQVQLVVQGLRLPGSLAQVGDGGGGKILASSWGRALPLELVLNFSVEFSQLVVYLVEM